MVPDSHGTPTELLRISYGNHTGHRAGTWLLPRYHLASTAMVLPCTIHQSSRSLRNSLVPPHIGYLLLAICYLRLRRGRAAWNLAINMPLLTELARAVQCVSPFAV